MKCLITIIGLLILLGGCTKEALFSEQSRHDLWLVHEGAKLPVVIEGNTASKVFVILLHGGPGGSAQEFNSTTLAFTNPLEEDYAMVYYDQRNAGLALGDWEEEKLTIEQHVEDLEKIIELIQFKFGDDIQLFLAGHSWGGYLGTRFLLKPENQTNINAWINIDGLINRNLDMFHVLNRITFIGNEQISNDINTTDWEAILNQTATETAKGITQYDVITEDNVFDLYRLAFAQLQKDAILANNFNTVTPSIYSDNYDPFRILVNGKRDDNLITAIYNSDQFVDLNLSSINIPSLSIYGYYDLVTPIEQGAYFTNKIGTTSADKQFTILANSEHSSMRNEPVILANEMKNWIEQYR